MRVLYIGGFILPDKNAAAQRVVANAKALRELDHTVYFLNTIHQKMKPQWCDYFGFACYECYRGNILKYLTSIKIIKNIIKNQKIDAVIAYNYPAIGLKKLSRYCRKHNIKIIADVTEWYVPQGNAVFRLIKNYDTNLRMKKLHVKMDGVIAISEYLYNYYKEKVFTVKIPPLVDVCDDKWNIKTEKNAEILTFIYAGSPSAQKERLDIVVENIEKISETLPVVLNVIGITEHQFNRIYKTNYCGEHVKFFGRVSNIEVVELTKQADWAVVLRDRNRVVEAGFPTKIVESITCGTPVIANKFSNIAEYLNENNSILIDSFDEFQEALFRAADKKCPFDNTCFDYHNYLVELQDLFQ